MRLKVITLNCWGLIIAKDHRIRIKAIVEDLLANQYDIICLQEIFCKYQIELIKSTFTEKNYFFYYFRSGLVGSGLVVVSLYPINDTFYLQYPERGTPFQLGGDWYCAKGVAVCKVLHPEKHFFLFNTHLNANYSNSPNIETRTYQMVFLSKIITKFSEILPVILTGDMNSESGEPPFIYLRQQAGLVDCFEKSKSEDVWTYDTLRSKYLDPSQPPSRLDYIFHNKYFECLSYKHSFAYCERIEKDYSDHKAVEVELELVNDPIKQESIIKNLKEKYRNIITIENETLSNLNNGLQHSKFPMGFWIILILTFLCTFLSFIFYPNSKSISMALPCFFLTINAGWILFCLFYLVFSIERCRQYEQIIEDFRSFN